MPRPGPRQPGLRSSYAAAVARLSADRLAAARDLIDLRRVEDELRGHLCALQHEERLAARYEAAMSYPF